MTARQRRGGAAKKPVQECLTRRSGMLMGAAAILSARSARADGRVLKLYSDGGPASPYGRAARVVSEDVARRTNDQLRIELVLGIAAAGQVLGPKRAQGRGMIEAVRDGDADMAIVSAAALNEWLPDLVAFDLPFLFADAAKARAALDGAAGRYLIDKLPEQRLIGLAWGETGMLQLTTRSKLVRVPADLAGLSIRVQENPIQRETFSELGATAVSIPALPDAMTALREGKLDGLATTLWVMSFLHIEQVQHALSLTAHSYQPNIFLLSQSAHARLSPDERAALTAAAQSGVAENRAAIDRADAAALDALRGKGMDIEEHPDRGALREALQPLYARWRPRIAASLVQQLGI